MTNAAQQALDWFIETFPEGAFKSESRKAYRQTIIEALMAKAALDGWKLMPVEPTEEMIDAMKYTGSDQYDSDENYCGTSYSMTEVYKSAIEAAPKPPKG